MRMVRWSKSGISVNSMTDKTGNSPSKTESSEAQRRNAFANFLAAVDAKDMPMSMTATFQAGWDAAMRRPRSPPETNAHLPPDGTIDGDGVWRGGLWHPNHPENHAMLGNDPAALQRTIERHVRWRQTALDFMRQVIDGRGCEDAWPALAEFIKQSDSRLSSSAVKANEPVAHSKSQERRFAAQKANEGLQVGKPGCAIEGCGQPRSVNHDSLLCETNWALHDAVTSAQKATANCFQHPELACPAHCQGGRKCALERSPMNGNEGVK